MPSRLIIFTRYPVPGKTKTRLIPALGEEGAADLHRRMTEHTIKVMQPLAEDGLDIQVCFTGGDAVQMEGWLGADLAFAFQGEGDLGARMERAFRESFWEGSRKVIVVGTDCPDLDRSHVLEALALLEDNEMVLGPASDGGYYLIGMRSGAAEELFDAAFRGITWGSDTVFTHTVNALAQTGIDLGLLDDLDDVDEPADLIHWEKAEKNIVSEMTDLTISVVIPTLNEEDRIGDLLDDLARTDDVEVIVSDGGSCDETVQICHDHGVVVISSETGRSVQMNRGAMAASGDVLLFLHSDTRLPAGVVQIINRVMSRKHIVGGAFAFSTDMGSTGMRVVEDAANWRSRNLGIVFGDQAIFVGRNAFEAAGGFPDQPIMEDYQLVRQIRRVGKIVLLPDKAVTSARRWRENGVFRTTLRNQIVTWLYMLGVSPERLARWYFKKSRQ